MQLKYKYFYGGDRNPFQKEVSDAYRKLSEERKIANPENNKPLEVVFPLLDSWPLYVIAESKSTFWKMERAIGKYSDTKAHEVENVWRDAIGQRKVDKWILEAEGDETEKAMCYYIKVQHNLFSPNDKTVDFRLYFSEGGEAKHLEANDGFTLDPYEE